MIVKNDTIDLIIDLGKKPSQIGKGYKYAQNALFAGIDERKIYFPIGHVIKNGEYYQKYYKDFPWSAFIVPYEGRPFVGELKETTYQLAFLGTPCIKKDGVVFINSKEEKTAPDILQRNARSAIGVWEDGTIELYTTQMKITLEELAEQMPNCVDILNLDGGGSVSPTNSWERPTSSAIVVKGGYNMKHFETYTRVTSGFGYRRSPITGKEEFHTGIDLVKKHKGEVYATVEGKVVHAKMAEKYTGLGGYGNSICVVDQDNHLHLYAHLDTIVVKEGSQVLKGQVIGYQGNTGKSAGSHLHYEVRSKPNPYYGWGFHIDPIKYLNDYETKYNIPEKPKDWKQEGLEYLQKELGVSEQWKPTDIVDMGTLGTILRRIKK